MKSLDVLCFGEALIDFFGTPGVPLGECETFTRHLGGAPTNVAIGLGRLGVRVGMMTLVGQDEFGEFVRRKLAEEGVDIASVGVHAQGRTGITFVAVAKNGDRSFSSFRHQSTDQMIAPDLLDRDRIASAQVVHLGSSTLAREPARSATLRMVEVARKAGCIVSCDPNWRAHLWPDPSEAKALLPQLLAGCDIVKLSDDELEPLVGITDVERAADRVRGLGPSVVVVTQGAGGARFFSGKGTGDVPAPVVDMIDATGAGDGFVAGFLSALVPQFSAGTRPIDLTESDLAAACRRGNEIGSQVVTAVGATTAIGRLTAGAPQGNVREGLGDGESKQVD